MASDLASLMLMVQLRCQAKTMFGPLRAPLLRGLTVPSFAALALAGLCLLPHTPSCWVLGALAARAFLGASKPWNLQLLVMSTEQGKELPGHCCPEGRPILEVTDRLRDRYWEVFLSWLRSEMIDPCMWRR